MQKGFSTLELVTVLLLVSVLSVFAVFKVPTDNFSLAAESDQLSEHMRYAQFLAIATDTRVKIEFSFSGYTLSDTVGNPIAFPESNSNIVQLRPGHSLTSSHSVIVYDTFGRPFIDQTIPGTPLSGSATFSLSWNGYNNNILLTQETGKISKL